MTSKPYHNEPGYMTFIDFFYLNEKYIGYEEMKSEYSKPEGINIYKNE